MQKRNLTLLTIVLLIIIVGVFGFFYFYKPTSNIPGDTSTGINFFGNFLPFGKNNDTKPTNTNPADVSGYVAPTKEELPKENLLKVSTMPVAGFGIFMKERFKDVPVVIPALEIPVDTTLSDSTIKKDKSAVIKPTAPPTEFIPTIRYVEKATGNIYQTFADKIDERKFTTTVIPRVYEAFFSNKGESVIMRYLKDGNTIETFVGALPKEILGADTMSTTELVGSFLPENITDLSVAFDTSKIFYLFNYKNNVVGINAGGLGDKKIQIFNSPFTEWLSSYPSFKMITLSTKPSANVPGFMYALDPNKKSYNKILGDINGLTTLTSPNGNLVLYSGNDLSLHIYHIDTNTSDSLGVKTLPEKCAWNKLSTTIYCAVPKFINNGEYPDAWYQGEISFSDEIWRIDAQTNNAFNVADPISFNKGEDIDGTKLSLDENESYLFLINKKDSYLWELKIK